MNHVLVALYDPGWFQDAPYVRLAQIDRGVVEHGTVSPVAEPPQLQKIDSVQVALFGSELQIDIVNAGEDREWPGRTFAIWRSVQASSM